MSNPFDAAIDHLARLVKLYPDGFAWGEECKAAIRVLEAAGKVDKGHSLLWLNAAIAKRDQEYPDSVGQFSGQIRALLAALPDKEGE
jgi:hypothetical protein